MYIYTYLNAALPDHSTGANNVGKPQRPAGLDGHRHLNAHSIEALEGIVWKDASGLKVFNKQWGCVSLTMYKYIYIYTDTGAIYILEMYI